VARRVASNSGQVPQSLRRPPHQWCLVADVARRVASNSGQVPQSLRRRDQTPSIPPASHPAVTSHIPEPTPNFACNSPETISNLEF
ncbi:MAG: hypothetical protein ACLR2J_03950, partial [Actinomyces sp.]